MIRGERFELDLEDGDGQDESEANVPSAGVFVGDILERRPAAPKPPTAPTLRSTTGFPEHTKRNVQSRFKQRNGATADTPPPKLTEVTNTHGTGRARTWEEDEKQRIDLENRQKLSHMSSAEIEAERQELMDSLSPALLQRLLQRSNIDSGMTEEDLSNRPGVVGHSPRSTKSQAQKTVSFAELPDPEDEREDVTAKSLAVDEVHNLAAAEEEALPHDSVHFPKAPQPPDLDPSSATFLQDLHEKYFPSLPSDPDKLEWMQASSAGENDYDPLASALKPKDLRFSFKGELIPPKMAAEIPVTAGLHHHGDAPDAAGYTIPELAHLAQSSYPAQRCIAFQTLGRVLYRLGKGEFGDSGEPGADTVGAEDTFGELARGLWYEVEKQRVIETLVRESEGLGADRGRHVSAKAYATEAVWLWRKGGGRRWKAE